MIGEKLADRYEIVSELGRGGMGVVYRARDPVLNRDVAIKVVSPAVLTPEIEQRFQSEAQVVAQLDHPCIVSIHDFGRHGGSLFFVMPVVEGVSMRQLGREQDLTLGEILEITISIAEALEYSRSRDVVHRDIKPENVMISRDPGAGLRVRVMDFGLARMSEGTRLTKTGTMVGTMFYVSPEQVSGAAIDSRSDIYSLGAVLYECITGEVPFAGEMQSVLYRVVHEIPQPPRDRGAEIDGELEAIILSCLEKEPENRPQTPDELVQQLRHYRDGLKDSAANKSVIITRTMQAKTPRAALSPFVGRKNEFKELQLRLNAAIAGECQFVTVSGDAGTGKTRLLDELETLAGARQIRVLHGRFVEQDGAFPYHGFCEVIQEYFRQKESGSASSAQPDFSDLSAELVALFPMLAEVDAFRSTSSGSEPVAAGAETHLPESRTQIFELLARAIIRLSGGKPLVLLLEDLHGAEISLEALQYIVRRLGPTPTLIVGTYRTGDVDRHHPLTGVLETFQGDRNFLSITLAPFTRSEHRELLSTLMGGSPFADELAARLFEGTEGNPFFTKELIRSLLDAGNIVRDKTGVWSLPGGVNISAESLPATIQKAVEKRIGRLPEDLRDLLSIASVMGKTFDFRDLESLTGAKGDLDDAVDKLIQEGLVEEERRSRGDTLTFTSVVVREVLYAEVSRRKRRSLHRKYAAQLEKRHSGKLERIYPRLVYHYSEADDPEKTVEYGLKHARRSLEAFSPEEAVRSVKTALEFIDEDWEGEPIEGEARMLLARAHEMSEDVDGALRELEAAVRIHERDGQAGKAVEAMLVAARTAWQARRPDDARGWVERGMGAARAGGENESLGQLLTLGAGMANMRGEYDRAAEYLEEAKSLGVATGDAGATREIARGGRLVVALANPVAAIEPADIQIVEDWEVLANVFEPLLKFDAEGNLIPLLCEKWEVKDEGRSFLFPLREGVRFHDGRLVTAAAIKSAFERTIRQRTTLAPAFVPVEGVPEFVKGDSNEVTGIVAHSDLRLEIRLTEPLPIYSSLLTDATAGIFTMVAGSGGEADRPVGTGPFRIASRDETRVVLERNPDYRDVSVPRLDAVEFRPGLSASAIAKGLESGEIDVAGDLLPKDLERLTSVPRFRKGLVETPAMCTYFLLFNQNADSPVARREIRQALCGVVRPHDLVWQALGRFAQPAVGLLPPGMLGHDPGRRPDLLSMEEARSLLRSAGAPDTLHLRAAVHPLVQDRYGSLLTALFSTWSELGVKVSVETPDMASYMDAWKGSCDLGLMRWAADYNDPDNFTHNLFSSATGQLRAYYSSAETDELLAAARRESDPTVREGLYRKFENGLLGGQILVPLFHDVDYRLASPRVQGLRVKSSYPVVNYADLGKVESEAPVADVHAAPTGTLNVPMSAQVPHIDPALCTTLEETESLSCIYETLTRVREGRIEPWLAAAYTPEEGGRKYRFRLRNGVRFHDGRRLTSRDVRFSFERLLQTEDSATRGMYAVILGADSVIKGKATALAGFHIHSATEFTIELVQPLSFFPVLISFTSAAVVPEGTKASIGSRTDNCAPGTGPYQIIGFEPNKRLELQRNPLYWREGYPRSQRLTFSYGVPPKEILSGFKAGRYHLAGDLFPADAAALRREPGFAAGYREAPSLSTYFVMFNIHRGPFKDKRLRQRLVQAGDIASLVRDTLGQRALPAHGYIPPGLLGYETAQPAAASDEATAPTRASQEIELSVAVHPVFTSEFADFYAKLESMFHDAGFALRNVTKNITEYVDSWMKGKADAIIGRWYADFPDTDGFVYFLSTQEGSAGVLLGSPELDKLIEQGRAELDPANRHAIYRQVENHIEREHLMLPLFHEQIYRFARPEVEGLTVSYEVPSVAYEALHVKG